MLNFQATENTVNYIWFLSQGERKLGVNEVLLPKSSSLKLSLNYKSATVRGPKCFCALPLKLSPLRIPTVAYVRQQRVPISAMVMRKAKMAAGGMVLVMRSDR